MKNFTLYTLIFLSTLVFAQKPNEIYWTYKDFIENEVNKVSKYSIALRKNGKVKKRDSTLIFTKEIDLDSNTIYGINSNLVVVTHVGFHLTWNKFKDYYNNKGLILKETSLPLEIKKKKEFGFTEYDENVEEIIYEYDIQENLVRKKYRTINNHYSIYKSSKDTLHLKSIYRPQIYEYVYNSDNQEFKQFYLIGSRRYLNFERKYDQQKRLVEWVSYTRENELHTKRYYFYDNENRLKKQIDSTGWYIYKKPYWKSTITYEYNSSTITKIIDNNTESKSRSYYKQEVIVSDLNNNIISERKLTDSKKEFSDYTYKWKKGNLVEKTETNSDGQIITKKFEYINRNLLTEKSEYLNGKRIELIRYYYEK